MPFPEGQPKQLPGKEKDIICQSEMTEVMLGLKAYQRYVGVFVKCVQWPYLWTDTITETFENLALSTDKGQ